LKAKASKMRKERVRASARFGIAARDSGGRLANFPHGGVIYAKSESSIDHSLTESLAVMTKKLKVSTSSVTRA
jgi:inactivated superfamily I helicase